MNEEMEAIEKHLTEQLLAAETEADRLDRLRHYGPGHSYYAEWMAGRAAGLRSALEAIELLTKGSNA
jgi:hypothetical protein